MLGLGNNLVTGGAPSEFTLASVSGLDIWLKYNTGFTSDEGSPDLISQWDDQSGNGNHATQSTDSLKPTLTSGGANFGDGGADRMDFSEITNVVYTIFIVIEADDANSMTMFGGPTSTTFFRIDQATNTEFRIRKADYAGTPASEDTADIHTAEPFVDNSTPFLLVFHQKSGLDHDVHICGNGGTTIFQEDLFGVQASGGTNTTLVLDHLGTQGATTNSFDGRILEFAIYDSTISDANIALVKEDMASRTGVTLS